LSESVPFHSGPVPAGGAGLRWNGGVLMRKMGWHSGEGLGKHREGTVEPIIIDFKTDRKGLVAEGEKTQKSGNIVVMKDLLGGCLVVVNRCDYQYQTASPKKKHAKAMAATVALQAMGEVAGDSFHTGPMFPAHDVSIQHALTH
ncbi:hypothetical protein cypCar_00009347, partial [Cyprinus carpio]